MTLREYVVEGRVRPGEGTIRVAVAATSPHEALERAWTAHIDLVAEYDLDHELCWEVRPL